MVADLGMYVAVKGRVEGLLQVPRLPLAPGESTWTKEQRERMIELLKTPAYKGCLEKAVAANTRLRLMGTGAIDSIKDDESALRALAQVFLMHLKNSGC